ncbi:MAG: low molecular weight phosphotyrosine protein phosphatase [Acidimicrobiia bacterium]|nr:low molecular weight phosphotyrosine protein phosphatase [Acidimicrobiia bacterium]
MRIVVVCTGNTCRSPAAEAAIRSAAERAGVSIEVSSAGTSAEEIGAPPTPVMVDAGRARGLEISGTASQVTPDQLDSADLVLAVDHRSELFLRSLTALTPIELLGSYDASSPIAEIPDPYGADEAVYAATLERIISAAEAFVASLGD